MEKRNNLLHGKLQRKNTSLKKLIEHYKNNRKGKNKEKSKKEKTDNNKEESTGWDEGLSTSKNNYCKVQFKVTSS